MRRAPVWLGMALLLLPWAASALGFAVRQMWPGAFAFEPGLVGERLAASPPAPGVAAIWSGAFQRRYARSFDQDLPLLGWAVGLKNQLYFSLLQQSGTPGVVVGKHLQLFEPEYISEYCGRNSAALLAQAEPWAAALAAMQHWYDAQGRVFVYIVTPSKAATYPQYIPGPCRSPPADRDALLPGWDAMLDRYGVRHVDAATLVRAAKPRYAFELFPRGSTHWNEVAAALAAQAVVRAVAAAATPWRLQAFGFTWRMTAPVDVARDLTDLLNLPFPRLDYEVPTIAIEPPNTGGTCHPPHVAMVGGSFSYEIIWTLMRSPCAPTVDFYSYFGITHAAFPGDLRHDVDPAQRDDALLHSAQIVLLEENEQVATRSVHGRAFYALVAAQPAAAAP